MEVSGNSLILHGNLAQKGMGCQGKKGGKPLFFKKLSPEDFLRFHHTLASRRRLIEDGTLVEDGGHLTFTRDSEFTSPSAAATVVHGGSANGLLAWKNKDGKTLKEIEAV